MRLRFILITFLILVHSTLYAESFFQPVYETDSYSYLGFINDQVQTLYSTDEDRREKAFIEMKTATKLTEQKGDNFFVYSVMARFILSKDAPPEFRTDEDYKDDIVSLQEDVLGFLIEQVEDDENSVSDREMLIQELARIAANDKLADFDMNSDAIKVLIILSEDESIVLKHAAIVGLKDIVIKQAERWESLAEDSAKAITEELEDDNLILQRIAFVECIDVLEKGELANDATRHVWDAVTSALGSVNSPNFKEEIKLKMEKLVKEKSGTMFKEEVTEAKEQLIDTIVERTTIQERFEVLLEMLKEESEPDRLEALMVALKKEAGKDRKLFNIVFWRLVEASFLPELPAYKLRIMNETLVDIVHDMADPLYFYQVGMTLLGEMYLYENSYAGGIPLAILIGHLSSTDFEGLILPLLQVIRQSAQSDLPVWIQRRLITLIFIQAGDSPNQTVAVEATKYLWLTVKEAKIPVLRWECMNRLRYLAKFSRNKASKEYAQNILKKWDI